MALQNQKTVPAERNYEMESQLGLAIRDRNVVRLRYDLDMHYRTFEPYVVFKATDGRILVGGFRVQDESNLFKKPGARKFEVGLITSLMISDECFVPNNKFKSSRKEFKNGVISAVDVDAEKSYQF
ncbi:hypothetical protein MNBD_GAMMA22-447 [hydrothermal vent metagenome]|uniref:WYL domain-containing protein n=1 Tax=hydrothermal vent metagenome TaxID=652676 RepID=A0A3B1BAZ5_9ZZZZ